MNTFIFSSLKNIGFGFIYNAFIMTCLSLFLVCLYCTIKWVCTTENKVHVWIKLVQKKVLKTLKKKVFPVFFRVKSHVFHSIFSFQEWHVNGWDFCSVNIVDFKGSRLCLITCVESITKKQVVTVYEITAKMLVSVHRLIKTGDGVRDCEI